MCLSNLALLVKYAKALAEKVDDLAQQQQQLLQQDTWITVIDRDVNATFTPSHVYESLAAQRQRLISNGASGNVKRQAACAVM